MSRFSVYGSVSYASVKCCGSARGGECTFSSFIIVTGAAAGTPDAGVGVLADAMVSGLGTVG